MRAYFGPLKEIHPNNIHSPPDGNFALEFADRTKSLHWDYCREQFAAKFTNTEAVGFFFSHPEKRGCDVANFLAKFEHISFTEPLSSFSHTNKENVTWVQVSPFWLSCVMKKSLLTMILRCGMNYHTEQDNFDDALFGEYKETNYVKDTRPAILRFMFGFTEFTGTLGEVIGTQSSVIKHGWWEEFKRLDEAVIRRRLVAPATKQKETSVVGIESLWA